jgi:branched-chain amino acid transport system ATP-binding protein
MLEVHGLNAAYGQAHILYDVALQANRGEVVVMLGRNGAGKSTTFKSIIGLVRPLSGAISFNGRRIERLESYRIARLGLGYVPEDRRIFTDLSVMENLEVGRQPPREGAPQWTPQKLFELFPNLAAMRARRGGQMSGGEQQMLTIARTLMGNPDLLLLDEPSEGLAPVIVENMLAQIQRLKREGLTILLAEQGLDFSLALADRVYVLQKGSVEFSGTSAELRDDQALRDRLLAV